MGVQLSTSRRASWRDEYLPREKPSSIEHALSLLGIDYYDRRSEHDYRPTQYTARCPFPEHRDRKPSFGVNSQSGLWHCFGCGEGGNLARLVTQLTRAPKHLAERWLEGVMYELCAPRWEPPEYNYYAETRFTELFTDPPGWALDERGIDEDAASDLGIRWCDDDTDSFWILPVRHPDNFRVIGWQSKSIGRKYINTLDGTPKSQTLFGIELLQPRTPAIVVEDALDAAVMMSAGYSGAVATFGASISDSQIQLLANRASQLLIAFDNDDAGDKGLDRIRNSEHMVGKRMYQFNYMDVAPDAKDPGEMSDAEIKEAIHLAERISRQ
jgi:CHC2 zinc finger/Toprim domain